MPNYKHLTPFKRCVLQNFPFIEADFDALTNYGLMCKIVEYLNNVISSQNTVQTNVETLNNAFIELKSYVDNYFDNLDVQEEINNKLDEMAESGYFDEILDEYFSKKINYLFPKYKNSSNSEYFIVQIKDKNETKNILVDCGTPSSWANLVEMCTNYEITHFDMFIVSHYDADHVGNVQNLITYHFIDNTTTVYTPVQYGFNADYSRAIADTNALFTNANISYRTPNELETIEYEGTKLTFANTDATIVAAYTSQRLNNTCSSVVLFEYGSTSAFFAGDATKVVLDRLAKEQFPNKTINLYKIPHHGIDYSSSTTFPNMIKPEYAVQIASISDFSNNNISICPETRILKELGTSIYPTFMNKDYIEFQSTIDSIECIQGVNTGISNSELTQDLYVDASIDTTDFQDGSQENPFKEIEQAIAAIQNYNANVVTIHVGAGTYSISGSGGRTGIKNLLYVYTGKGVIVNITGNSDDASDVVINGVSIRNSIVNFANLTIDCKYRNGMYIYHSNVEFNNVVFDTSDGSLSSNTSGLIIRNHSDVTNRGGLTIRNCVSLMLIQWGSTFRNASTLTLGTFSSKQIQVDSDCIVKNLTKSNVIFENSADSENFNEYYVSAPSGKEILDTVASDGKSATLTESLGQFYMVEYIVLNGNIQYSSGKIYVSSSKANTIINAPAFGGDGKIYGKMQRIMGDTKAITMLCKSYTFTPGSTSITCSDDVTPVTLTHVIGYKKDRV